MKAYWFEPASGVLGYGDERKPEIGKSHSVKCKPVLCHAGLHGSVCAMDALQYAQSSRLWLVDITGDIKIGEDKICGQRREYIAVADVELVLREFARECALDVIHLWDAPQIVRDYLESGDDNLRAAARAAARVAAWDAARAAAWDAARAAARAAAMAAAGDAAWAAAWAASGDAAWDAAWDAQNQRLENALTKIFTGQGATND